MCICHMTSNNKLVTGNAKTRKAQPLFFSTLLFLSGRLMLRQTIAEYVECCNT